MKITIEFTTDNAAFEEGSLAIETHFVLEQVRRHITENPEAEPHTSERLRDHNGNTIGEVRFS